VQGGWTGSGSNDISQDPLFVDAKTGNLHLQPKSPAIDTGTNTYPATGPNLVPSFDLDGNPRPVDGGTGKGAITDMGAYEFQGLAVPTVSLASGQANPTNTSPLTFQVVFSMPVTGFTSSGVALSGPAGATVQVQGSGTTYNLTVSGMTQDGTVTVGINADAATDPYGNQSAASAASSSVTYDTTPPTAAIVSEPTAFTYSTSAAFSLSGSDPVSNGVASGVASLVYQLDRNAPVTVPLASVSPSFTGLSQGQHTLTVCAIDNAGNKGAATSYSWVVVSVSFGSQTLIYNGSPQSITYTVTPKDALYKVSYYQGNTPISEPSNAGNYTVAIVLPDGTQASQAFSIGKASPTISAVAGPTVVIGSGVKLTASATLTGGANEAGTITFTLYDSTGASVDTQTATVNGPGTYTTPTGYLPSAPGTYQWVASYSGDPNNYGAGPTTGTAAETAVSTGVTLVGGALYLVGGSATNDQVTISATAGSPAITVNAVLNGVSVSGSYTPNALYVVGFAGNENFQTKGPITIPVIVSAGDGNDSVQFAGANGNTTVTLGNGNDTVTLGGGNNTVTVGNGNDNITLGGGNNIVVEGNGHDSVHAGNGDNLIVGGLGQHTIQVGNGSNILIDGSVQLMQAGDTLAAVLAAWIQNGNTPTDLVDIRSRLQVTDNTTNANTMLAGNGFDWFWASYARDMMNDKATDLLN
jgi:hypothetical protein